MVKLPHGRTTLKSIRGNLHKRNSECGVPVNVGSPPNKELWHVYDLRMLHWRPRAYHIAFSCGACRVCECGNIYITSRRRKAQSFRISPNRDSVPTSAFPISGNAAIGPTPRTFRCASAQIEIPHTPARRPPPPMRIFKMDSAGYSPPPPRYRVRSAAQFTSSDGRFFFDAPRPCSVLLF